MRLHIGRGEQVPQRRHRVVRRRGVGVLGREPIVDRRDLPPRAQAKVAQGNVVAVERAGDEAAAVEVEQGRPGRRDRGPVQPQRHRRRRRRAGSAVVHGHRRRRALHGDDLLQLRPVAAQPSPLVGGHRLRLGGDLVENGRGLRIEHGAVPYPGRNESGVWRRSARIPSPD